MSVSRSPLPSVSALTQLQIDAVQRWHHQPIDAPFDGFEALVCRQHEFNYRLWHQEDIARSPSVTDTEIATVKREIDKLNQQRNDMIEKVDDAITDTLAQLDVHPLADATLATETPGSAIDRLSIMSLRLYHYREQLERTDVDQSHRQKVQDRISLCETQHRDLTQSLQELLDDQFAGRKIHKTYRQMKMYNDPSLNPEIYNEVDS
ncbi:MAG: DUF4254 domain-containing protein [Planctomycetota bacterium]